MAEIIQKWIVIREYIDDPSIIYSLELGAAIQRERIMSDRLETLKARLVELIKFQGEEKKQKEPCQVYLNDLEASISIVEAEIKGLTERPTKPKKFEVISHANGNAAIGYGDGSGSGG